MNIQIRTCTATDAEACAHVIFHAFLHIAERHNFPGDFESVEHARHLASMASDHPAFYGVVAELDGRIVGSNFIDLRGEIGGVGPITVHPDFHGKGIGKRLMLAVIERGRQMRGIRLVQDSFNTVSLSLYASLGFDSREPLALMSGKPRDARADGSVRPMREADVDECEALCRKVHGISRIGELPDAIKQFKPFVRVRGGRVCAYLTAPSVWLLNHGVAETDEDLRALLLGASAQSDEPLAMLFPIRQAALFRWCLEQGLRVIKPMTLMSMGTYHEPKHPFFPSVQH